MDYVASLFQKLMDLTLPPGTIIPYGGTEVPEGFLLVQNVKVYQDEYPRLYDVLAPSPKLQKGNDSGRAWVMMVDPDKLCIQLTTDGSAVWEVLEASLPNIGGGFGYLVAVQNWGINGAFSSGSTEDGSSSFDTSGQHAGVFFSARNSSSVYNGETLQPSALQALPCIRT